MEINLAGIAITLSFTPEDLAVIQQNGTTVPPFWTGHLIPPALHDLLRFGGLQYRVDARAWEHNGELPVLRLSAGSTQSDIAHH